jgi:hypothetical protein
MTDGDEKYCGCDADDGLHWNEQWTECVSSCGANAVLNEDSNVCECPEDFPFALYDNTGCAVACPSNHLVMWSIFCVSCSYADPFSYYDETEEACACVDNSVFD